MEASETWFCCILECGDRSLYAWVAKDPVQRVKRHNWGAGMNIRLCDGWSGWFGKRGMQASVRRVDAKGN
jgi:hypothetical protein